MIIFTFFLKYLYAKKNRNISVFYRLPVKPGEQLEQYEVVIIECCSVVKKINTNLSSHCQLLEWQSSLLK